MSGSRQAITELGHEYFGDRSLESKTEAGCCGEQCGCDSAAPPVRQPGQ